MVPVSVFFTCRFCSLRQKCRLGIPRLALLAGLVGEWSSRWGQCRRGRDLALAGFQDARGVPSLPSGLSSCFLQ